MVKFYVQTGWNTKVGNPTSITDQYRCLAFQFLDLLSVPERALFPVFESDKRQQCHMITRPVFVPLLRPIQQPSQF